MTIESSTKPRHPWLGLAGWLAITFVAAVAGALASRTSQDFYLSLARPSWAPPPWLFGPAWTFLYVTMAIAAWMVWRERGFRGARAALSIYLVQLVFNAMWTWLFFVRKQGAWSMADIAVLWCLVAVTLVAFYRHRRVAGLLIVPYLGWVTFAAALNYAVWRMNPQLLG